MKLVKDVIALKFRTTAADGVLLYGEGQQGDYVSLELRRARLQLSMNLGRFHNLKARSDDAPSAGAFPSYLPTIETLCPPTLWCSQAVTGTAPSKATRP